MSIQSDQSSSVVLPIYESPVAQKFKNLNSLGTRRIEMMISAGVLPYLSPTSKKKAVYELKKYSNMRDTEEKIQRLEILEKLLNLKKAKGNHRCDIEILTAMYMELGRRLKQKEFQREIVEAMRPKRNVSCLGPDESFSNQYPGAQISETEEAMNQTPNGACLEPEESISYNSRRTPVLIPKIRRIPNHLIEGYYNGLDLLVRSSNIILVNKKSRKARFSKQYKIPVKV